MGHKDPYMLGDFTLFSILAFALSFIFYPAGLGLAIAALSELKHHNDLSAGSKWFAWAAIIVPPALFIMAVLWGMVMIGAIGGAYGYAAPWGM